MAGFFNGITGCIYKQKIRVIIFYRTDEQIRTEFCVGSQNGECRPIAKPENVLMPPLHIKTRIMKKFV